MLDRPVRRLSAGTNGVIAAIAAAVVAITYWRIWYGVDFTDESFYVAVPYRFALGAKPFVDETSVTQQTTAILLYPFVRAYYAVTGMTGIVLFVRHLQFLLSLLVGGAVYRSLRLFLERRLALAVSLAAVVFVPFTIHSLSYDSVGSALLTAGCFLGVKPLVDSRARASRLGSALCLGLAAFAYPPLMIPVAVCVAVRIGLARGHRLREGLEHGVVALGLPVLGLVGLAASAGLSTVVADYRHSSEFLGQAGGVGKLRLIYHQTQRTLPHWWAVVPTVAMLWLAWRYRRGAAVVALAALPLLVLPPRVTFFTASLNFAAHLGWIAPALFVLVRARPGAKLLFLTVWVPSFVAGATTAYSSANGAVNFGVGGFPTAIVTTVYLIWAFEDAVGRIDRRAVALAPALTVLGLLFWSDTIPVYRDGSISALSARVQSGPYAGLATTPWKRAWIDRLQHDLERYEPTCTILFFDDFPAGYLLSEARPDTNGAWVATIAQQLEKPYQDELLRYYRSRSYPDVVVVMRRIPYTHHSGRTELYATRDPLLETIRPPAYRLALRRRTYAIYRRATVRCGNNPHGPIAHGKPTRV
ncbi:MAG TPA: hypothetical protein VHS03_11980 [Gaiellaceae bacterium]|nr:hypothetical protein [Gaiellaceae bacterium]